MHKRFLAAFLLLSVGFSLCEGQYASRFYRENAIPREPVPVEAAALIDPSPTDRLSYAFARRLCPGELKGYLDKTVSLAVAKKVLRSVGKKEALAVFASEFPEIYKDALSPRAMSYDDSLKAMERAIANAYALGVDCNRLEQAARLYYTYSLTNYERDICAGKSTLEKVVSILRVSRGKSIEAVPYSLERVGKKEVGGSAPLCHPCLKRVLELAESRNASLSDVLTYAALSVARECPVKSSYGGKDAILSRITGDTEYFLVGKEEVPVIAVRSGFGGNEIVNIGNESFTGYAVVGDADVPVSLDPGEKVRQGNGINYLLVMASLALVVGWGYDRRKKGSS